MLNKKTYAQAGEDSILAYVAAVLGIPFGECNYIDIGANRPKEMSNTFFFYSHGARGILVEADPRLIPGLRFYRSEDVILNRCIASSSGKKKQFNLLNIEGISTAGDIENLIKENEAVKLVERIEVETISFNEIVETYMPEAPVLLTIDVEGMDFKVLQSINWTSYRPLILIVETIPYSMDLLVESKEFEIIEYMNNQGYCEYAFTGINSIFLDKNRVKELNIKRRNK
ncbi:MAG: FkbM family methyltransferase [Clostridiales bacterium]|nr:FkbM family methyltransferase [Clostridiales bacterium]